MIALVLAMVLGAEPALAAPRWIVDDWPRAQAEAREREVPIVVETWVPW